jgi:hypothetical protein
MDKTKINKGRMYRASDLVLEKYSGLFGDHAGLRRAQQQLKNGIRSIDELQNLQVGDNKGLTLGKEMLRSILTRLLLKFALALKSLATMQQNQQLVTKFSLGISDLNRLPDPRLVNVGRMLQEHALPMQEELAKLFLAAEDFDQLEKLLAEFTGSYSQKRVAVTVSKSATAKTNEMFKTIDNLLKTEIDVHVAPFQFQHPDFYSEYCNARIIVGYTGGGASSVATEVLSKAG